MNDIAMGFAFGWVVLLLLILIYLVSDKIREIRENGKIRNTN